jgi:Fur family ferric uptake transcriptional regulator
MCRSQDGGGTKMAGTTDQGIEGLQDQLTAYMERKGLRSTSQRRLVSEVFFRTGGHLSIDDILALVRTQDPKVGYATVYRTLKLLVECGLANERQFEDTVTRFEVAHHGTHHDHLICLQCKRIIEFEDDDIERLQDALAERHGFQLVSHKHELYGLCDRCQQTEE